MASQPEKLSFSASAIGAAILGFGIGATWGASLQRFGIWIIVIGAGIHVYGMYIMQMKNVDRRNTAAKFLLITSWICLIALLALFVWYAVNR